jgi:hypothetical protein
MRGISDILTECQEELPVEFLPQQGLDGIAQAEDHRLSPGISHAGNVGQVGGFLNGEVSAFLILPQIEGILDAIQGFDFGQIHPFLQGIGMDGTESHPVPRVGKKAHLVWIGQAAREVSFREVEAHRLPFQAVDLTSLRALS